MSRHDSNQSKIYLSTAKLYSDNKEQYFFNKNIKAVNGSY